MPKTLRNKYYKNLTYEKLMQAHIKSRKGKNKSIWQAETDRWAAESSWCS